MPKRLAIITGASKGIGKACAHRYLQHGWRVINVSRTPCDLAEVTNCLLDFNAPDCFTKHGNLLKQIINEPQVISLVHNAAYYQHDSVANVTNEQLVQAFTVNVLAPVRLNQLLLDKMIQGSSIIYVGSTLSEKAVANTASYTMTKHAVVGLMRSTCQDLIGRGIHTCCVCPGFTDTEMLRAHVGHDDAVLAAIASTMSANRLITPQEIANLIYFCAENPAIDGSVLHANLGQIQS